MQNQYPGEKNHYAGENSLWLKFKHRILPQIK